MAAFDDKTTLERQQFFDGQLLLAGDLQGVIDDHRWRRELHNVSLHKPGIARGFPVTGEPGDREVTVGEGYALDSLGREIISTRTRVEPIPPVAGADGGGPAHYDLTVSYPGDERLEEAETRAGVCTERGVVRRREEPVFCWVRLEQDAAGELHPADPTLAAQIEAALRLRIARVEVEDCRLKSLSVAERRNARPPEQPTIRCGHAAPAWEVELLPQIFVPSVDGPGVFGTPGAISPTAFSGGLAPFFLTAEIDTAAAGFGGTPCYSAGLRGSRFLTLPGPEGEAIEIFADGVVSIESPTPKSFRLRVLPVLFVEQRLTFGLDPADLAIPWEVEWLGVER